VVSQFEHVAPFVEHLVFAQMALISDPLLFSIDDLADDLSYYRSKFKSMT
jgi:hypothetical protein